MIGKYNWFTLSFVNSTTPQEDDYFNLNGPLNYAIISNPSGYTGDIILSVCPNASSDTNIWAEVLTITCDGQATQLIDSEVLANIAGCTGTSSLFKLDLSTSGSIVVYFNSVKP